MQCPSPGWILAGVSNLEIMIYCLDNILIDAGTDLHTYRKRSKSIIGLTHRDSNVKYK